MKSHTSFFVLLLYMIIAISTLTNVSLGGDEDDDDDGDPQAPTAELVSLEFTSDHNLLRDGADLYTPGNRFPTIEWTAAGVNAPITHTASVAGHVEVTLTLGIENVAANTAYTLTGTSVEGSLNFSANGHLGSGAAVALTATASNAIGVAIRSIDQPIEWNITIGGNAYALGNTGNHIIYTTIGIPAVGGPSGCTLPNVARITHAQGMVSSAQAAAAAATPAHPCTAGLVWEMNMALTNGGSYYLGRNLLNNIPGNIAPDVNLWKFPLVATVSGATAYDQNSNTGADCISMSMYLRNVCMVIGVPGTFDARTYAALYKTQNQPQRPMNGHERNLGSPAIYPGTSFPVVTTGLQSNWRLALRDGSGGLNNFEAAMLCTVGGTV